MLAFISRGNIKPLTVKKGSQLNTRYGNFEHDKMIGLKYGSQMAGSKGYGFVHLLHPTPELWTVSLPHRTQIVYTPDSSYVMQRLGVTSGTRVIEAGTGSASFTHSFARTVGSEGKLYTYEFHEPRYVAAKDELEQHGLLNVNTVITHRDVCNDGFEVNGEQINADVVFLDLPSPWTAIQHLDKVISSDSRVGICCFSPCIEQVEKTITALQDEGWTSIEMVEVAGRRWEARKDMVRSLDDVVGRLKDIQSRKNWGIESTRHVRMIEKREADEEKKVEEKKVEEKKVEEKKVEEKEIVDDKVPKMEEKEADNVEVISTSENPIDVAEITSEIKSALARTSGSGDSSSPAKKAKIEPESKSKPDSGSKDKIEPENKKARGFNPFGRGLRIREGDDLYQWRNVTKIETEVKSHTSYLTFAYKIPSKKVDVQ